MAKKKSKTKSATTKKHETKGRCAATNSKPECITFNNTLDDNATIGRTTQSASTPVETAVLSHGTIEAQHTSTQPSTMATERPREVISLLDLPLEILFMIFDYTTCRKHLIQLKDTRRRRFKLSIPRPLLLRVSKSLQSALSHHFYSSYSFHTRISTGQLLEANWDRGLKLQELDDILPYHLKLNTVRLTLEIASLSAGGFDFSILVDLGKKLFVDYEAMRLGSEEGIKLMVLNWRLVHNYRGRIFGPRPLNGLNLQLLLEEIHELAFKAVSSGSHSLQDFGCLLERHLKKDKDSSSPTYQIRLKLRQLWKHKRSVGRRVYLKKAVRPEKCT